jgi:hypothetical protein
VKLCTNVKNYEGGAVGIDEEGRFAHEQAHAVPLSAPDIHGLAFFTNGHDGAVGPMAWACDSEVGVDGSTVLRVHPPERVGSRDGVIIVETSGGACVGCALNMACGYFPAARTLALEWTMDFACSGRTARSQGSREAREPLSERHVRFESHPSGKRGRSGAEWSLSVSGVVAFDDSADVYAARLTCRIDASTTKAVCEAAAKTFIAEYPPRPRSGSASIRETGWVYVPWEA